MKSGRQWIHFDAGFPLGLGHDLLERFGPAGQLLFVQFLCACKRSFPQGRIRYRNEEEARVLLGAHYPLVDGEGKAWGFNDFWRWCGARRVARSTTNNGTRTVVATRWTTWERPSTRTGRAPTDESRPLGQENRDQPDPHNGRSEPENALPRGNASVAKGGGVRGERSYDLSLEGGECGGGETTPSARRPRPALGLPARNSEIVQSSNSNSKPTTNPEFNSKPKTKLQAIPADPLAARLVMTIAGCDANTAEACVERLRAQGIGDIVIDEAIGFCAERGDIHSTRFVERVAYDWMTQRDPGWEHRASTHDPTTLSQGLNETVEQLRDDHD